MNTSKTVRKTVRTWSAVMGLAMMGAGALGCGGEAVDGAAAESPLLFKDPAQSGPRVDVYDVGGQAAIVVGGPIGTEGRLAGLTGFESVDHLYRAVHPEASSAPAALTALAQRLAPAMAALRSIPRATEPLAAATIEKSQSAFTTNVCRNFTEGSSRYTPIECLWSGSTKGQLIFHAPPSILPGDRTFGWNNNPNTAKMSWTTPDPAVAGSITLPAFWWNWMSISGGNKRYWADISAQTAGELGLTHHSLSFIVK